MPGFGAEPGATAPTTVELTLGTLDAARAGDLTALFTLATLHADLYWQEDDQGICIGVSLNCAATMGFARKLVGNSLDALTLNPGSGAPDLEAGQAADAAK